MFKTEGTSYTPIPFWPDSELEYVRKVAVHLGYGT
jgi:hypothetical protein